MPSCQTLHWERRWPNKAAHGVKRPASGEERTTTPILLCPTGKKRQSLPTGWNKRGPVPHTKASGKISTMVLTWYHCKTGVLIGILWNCQEWTEVDFLTILGFSGVSLASQPSSDCPPKRIRKRAASSAVRRAAGGNGRSVDVCSSGGSESRKVEKLLRWAIQIVGSPINQQFGWWYQNSFW